MLIIGQAYDRCTACSKVVVDEYLSEGHSMLFKVFNEEKYLEKLTGLDKMYEETDLLEADLDVDWDEED
jgi:ubiquitin-like modifier-activating enzyme ATG7